MDIPSIIATTKDMVLGLSAIVGAWAAVTGLHTWNKQMRGQASYELARRLLRNTYQLRNAVLETHQDLVRALNSQSVKDYISDSNFSATSVGYINFDKSKDSAVFSDNLRTEMETDFLEAEVLWGIKIDSDFNKLIMMQLEIRFNHRWIEDMFHTLKKKGELETSEHKHFLDFVDKYSESSKQKYKIKLDKAVETAEHQLKRYLNRF